MRSASSARANGFTYAGVLVAVAFAGVGLAVTGEAWQTTMQREKERELLFVGDEIRKAITQYYDGTPGGVKQFPKKLEDLLRDERYPTVRRYLRKVYRDPMTGKREWGFVKGPGDTIMGVYSLSTKAPIKRANFPTDYVSFSDAASYTDWQFAYGSGGTPQGAAAAPAPTQPFGAPLPASAVVGKTADPQPAQAAARPPGGVSD